MSLLDGADFSPLGSSGLADMVSEMGGDIPQVSAMIERELASWDTSGDYGGLVMNGYHPSYIARRSCVLSYYYHLKDYRSLDPDPRTLRIFHTGDSMHSRLQKYMRPFLYGTWRCKGCHKIHNQHEGYFRWLKDLQPTDEAAEMRRNAELAAVVSASDTPMPYPAPCSCGGEDFRYEEWRVISEKYGITGKIDGIFKNSRDEWVGWEIKSANNQSYMNLGRKDSSLLQKYKRQLSVYLSVLGISYGVITVENKDNQTLRDFHLYLQDEDLSGMFTRLELATQMAKGKKKLPTARRNEDCRDCPYLQDPCSPTG